MLAPPIGGGGGFLVMPVMPELLLPQAAAAAMTPIMTKWYGRMRISACEGWGTRVGATIVLGRRCSGPQPPRCGERHRWQGGETTGRDERRGILSVSQDIKPDATVSSTKESSQTPVGGSPTALVLGGTVRDDGVT